LNETYEGSCFLEIYILPGKDRIEHTNKKFILYVMSGKSMGKLNQYRGVGLQWDFP
jgi:hypothetical protein